MIGRWRCLLTSQEAAQRPPAALAKTWMKAESRRLVHFDDFVECAPATFPKTKNDGTVCFADNVFQPTAELFANDYPLLL